MRRFHYVVLLALASCGGGGYYDLTPPEALELTEHFGGIAVADFDADGRIDIAVGTSLTEDRQLLDTRISIFTQHSTSPGSFLPPRQFDNNRNGHIVRGLAAGDFQQNGVPGLIATNWSEGGFRVLLNDPSQPGTLAPSVHYETGPPDSTFGRSHAVGDIDADGFPDVVIVTEEVVQWVPQNSGNLGTFGAPRLIGEGRDDVQLGDVNDDGLLDVVVLGADGSVSQSILVHYNSTNVPGQFLSSSRLTLADYADHVGVANYDGLGRVDIAVAVTQIDSDDFDSHAAMVVFRQTAPDVFSQSAVTRTGGLGDFEFFGPFETVDLDGDIFPELVFRFSSNVQEPVIRIMETNAVGVPSLRTDLVIPNEPGVFSTETGGLSTGDLNDDTLDDIALTYRGGLYVFFRQPGGPLAFDAAVRLNTPP